MPEIQTVQRHHDAALLLDPLRLRILEHARRPASATEIARHLDLPRQRVHYHVRELERAGFLHEFDRRRKRNMIERRVIASARAYVLDPDLLGSLAARPDAVRDRLSAGHLLAVTERSRAELIRAMSQAGEEGARLPTLAIDADIRFRTARERREFAEALQQAVTRVIAEHSSPACRPDGTPAPGRPYRLTIGCHPIPDDPKGAGST